MGQLSSLAIHFELYSLIGLANALIMLQQSAQQTDPQTDQPWGMAFQGTEVVHGRGKLLVTLAAKAGLEKKSLEYEFPRITEFPFSSERKRMSVVVKVPKSNRLGIKSDTAVFVKGSAELLLARCSRIGHSAKLLTATERKEILEKVDVLPSEGKRVLGFAYRPVEGNGLSESWGETSEMTVEQALIWLGLVAMIDAPRPEVKAAVVQCQQAGIRPVMITGDHPLTVCAIAVELGLVNDVTAKTYTGSEIEAMDQDALEAVVPSVSVYARVSPEHKLRIVQALQDQKQVLAMTGDGVNDAPALKQVDIGIAMGITDTDVSKEASDMGLLNANFASIVAAAAEGRVVYSNIRKFVISDRWFSGPSIGDGAARAEYDGPPSS